MPSEIFFSYIDDMMMMSALDQNIEIRYSLTPFLCFILTLSQTVFALTDYCCMLAAELQLL